MSVCTSDCLSASSGGLGVASSTFAATLRLLVTSQCLLTAPYTQRAQLNNGSSVDVIIVGGGSAGSALAARLATTNLTILLLEAGGDPPIESIVPWYRDALLGSPYDWNYTTVNDHYSSQELIDQRQRLKAGRMLGGTGSINSNVYARGFPADYDGWAKLVGDPTWNWENVLQYFKKTEKLSDERVLNNPSSLKYHGTEGDIQVAGAEQLDPRFDQIINAYKELGFKVLADRNNPEEIGIYHNSFNIKDGEKHSAVTAMLNKVADRENLHVMKNAFVTKILIENNTAYGVKVLINDQEWQFYANKEVVVSTGAYSTPKLLMLSGIGPKEHLQQHGIEVIQDLPVGNCLHDHFFVLTFLAADKNTWPRYQMSMDFEVIKYLYNRTGRLSTISGAELGVDYALKNSPTPNVADFSFMTLPLDEEEDFYESCMHGHVSFLSETCRYLEALTKKYQVMVTSVMQRQPKSRGVVRLASSNPLDKPVIRTNAFTHAEDLKNFREAIEVAWSLTNTSFFKNNNVFVVDLKLKSCEGLSGSDYMDCLVKGLVSSESHATGTARMGDVVDSRLRVKCVAGLRVVDASVMPTVPRANTNAAVIMIAEKAADFIKHQYDLN